MKSGSADSGNVENVEIMNAGCMLAVIITSPFYICNDEYNYNWFQWQLQGNWQLAFAGKKDHRQKATK